MVSVLNATDHPGFAGRLRGGWTGQLSSGGETIQSDDAAGVKVDDVAYADDGDWAARTRGPLSFGHRGWVWLAEHDGTGKSAEKIYAEFPTFQG